MSMLVTVHLMQTSKHQNWGTVKGCLSRLKLNSYICRMVGDLLLVSVSYLKCRHMSIMQGRHARVLTDDKVQKSYTALRQ